MISTPAPIVKNRPESPEEKAVKRWISENYGVISRVARENGCTAQHAHFVARGERRSRDLRIERALVALGCPIPFRIG